MQVSDLIFVGYKTRLRDDAERWIPEFEPYASCRTAQSKADNVAKQRREYLEKGVNVPFLAELEAVFMHSLMTGKSMIARRSAHDALRALDAPDEELIGREVVGTLRIWHPQLWQADYGWFSLSSSSEDAEYCEPGEEAQSTVFFVGFDPRYFTHLVASEAAESDAYLPASLWYGGSYRDANKLVKRVRGSGHVPLGLPLSRLGIPLAKTWTPGVHVVRDALVAALLTRKMGVAPWFNTQIDDMCELLKRLDAQALAEETFAA